MQVAIPWAISSTGIRRQSKRETLFSLDAWHSGDGLILLVCAQSSDHICMFVSNAWIKQPTSHELNRMQIRKTLCSPSLAVDSAHVKCGVWPWPNLYKWRAACAKLCCNVYLVQCDSCGSWHLPLYFACWSFDHCIGFMLHIYFHTYWVWFQLQSVEPFIASYQIWICWWICVKQLDTKVSCSKKGRGAIDVSCQSSFQNVVWNHCSLSFARFPMFVWLVVHFITAQMSCSQSC